MRKKLYIVSFLDRNGDTWGNQYAAHSHEDAALMAMAALNDDDEMVELMDFPAQLYVEEMELN